MKQTQEAKASAFGSLIQISNKTTVALLTTHWRAYIVANNATESKDRNMQTMKLTSSSGSETTVLLVRETQKAILVKGNASEAWFPRKAIDEDGNIAAWFQFSLVHQFLFHAPYAAR